MIQVQNFQALATASAGSSGVGSITLPNTSAATFSSNDVRLLDGFAIVRTGTKAGRTLVITGISAAAPAASMIVTWALGIDLTLSSLVGETIDIVASPYYVTNATNDGTNVLKRPVGQWVATSGAIGVYRWVQSFGMGSFLSNTTGTIAAGDEVSIAGAGASVGRVDTRSAFSEQPIGRAITSTTGASKNFACMINCEYIVRLK